MKPFSYLLLILTLFLAGCGKNPQFHLEAASDDIGTQNVTIRYVDANGAYRVDQIPAVNGHFSYDGLIDGPTYFELFDAINRPLGVFIATGGDNIKARFAISNPENITVEGDEDAILLKEWLDNNRGSIIKGDTEAVNAAVAKFVTDNPRQFASTAMLLNYFTTEGHEEQALQLLQSINEKQRPSSKVLWFEQSLNLAMSGSDATISQLQVYDPQHIVKDDPIDEVNDSIEAPEQKEENKGGFIFYPRGARINLLMITDNDSRFSDSIRQMVETLQDAENRRVETSTAGKHMRIVDLGCDRDTLLWNSSLRNTPEGYPVGVVRYWLPAGPATPGLAEAAPPAIPSFILTDSLGHLLHRTSSVRSMQHFIIHKNK